MISSPALPVSPRTHRAGFTLVEVILALGVIAFAFVALLGLLPAGLDASRKAVNSTVVGNVLEDLHNRLQGQPLVAGAASFSPAFFDDHGVFINPVNLDDSLAQQAVEQTAIQTRRVYRAEVNIGAWSASTKPAGTSGALPVTISLYWPVGPDGSALGKIDPTTGKVDPQTVVTYVTTTLSGSNWTAIDSNYVPKVDY